MAWQSSTLPAPAEDQSSVPSSTLGTTSCNICFGGTTLFLPSVGTTYKWCICGQAATQAHKCTILKPYHFNGKGMLLGSPGDKIVCTDTNNPKSCLQESNIFTLFTFLSGKDFLKKSTSITSVWPQRFYAFSWRFCHCVCLSRFLCSYF